MRDAILAATLVAAPLHAQSAVAFNGPWTMTVESERPLMNMLDRIQNIYKYPINYEEVPVENASELRVTNVPTVGGGMRISNAIGKFTVSLDQTIQGPYDATVAVMNAYGAAGLPGKFQVIPRAGSVDVIPIQLLGASGQMRQMQAMMGRTVTFPAAERPILATLDLLSTALSKASGFKVDIYMPAPENLTAVVGANSETARDVVSKIGQALGSMICYHGSYDPYDKHYYILVNTVSNWTPKAPGQKNPPMYIPPPQAGANNPFFTKAP